MHKLVAAILITLLMVGIGKSLVDTVGKTVNGAMVSVSK